VAPTHNEPDADAMPAASPRRQVRHGTMAVAVRRFNNRIATEAEITVPEVAERPTAGVGAECEDLFGDANRAWVGEGGCLGTRQGGLLRRRLGAQRTDSFDLLDRQHPRGQDVAHNADGVGDAAVAMLPTPDVPRGDVKQFGCAALADAERAERRAEFGPERC